MLTSPLNVTIASPSGAGLRPQATSTDVGPGHSPVAAPAAVASPAPPVIEPELPSNSAMTTVTAGTATVANRTVLQDLTLRVANLLQMPRGSEENLTALFIRIIAAVEKMNQAERLQFEIRSGLKALKITLTDLAGALKNPDGAEAARLTAMAEAPLATPGKTAANAATSTYLQEGTSRGQTEETLAMRAAARSNAAGLGLFSAETRTRADLPPADAKGLQDQLKTLFEPGLSQRKASGNPAAMPAGSEAKLADAAATVARSDGTVLRAANLKIDPQTAQKLHEIATEVAKEDQERDAVHADAKSAEKAETGDRRVQTMLTLKGLAEVITSLPGRAAELFAALPETAPAEVAMPNPADLKIAMDVPLPGEDFAEIPLPEIEAASDEAVASAASESEALDEASHEVPLVSARKPTAGSDGEPRIVTQENASPAKPSVAQQGVPFAYAVLQPAREEFVPEVAEADARDQGHDETDDEDSEDGEPRRPRDEYDEMRDPQPEEKPAIVINRDSTEADRAFALYQRMGGF